MVKKYRVELTEGERGELRALVSQGRAAAYKQTHARILLLSDENWGEGPLKDLEIAWVLQVGTATVERVRRRCVEALVGERNAARIIINWRFTTQYARVKLHRLYPFDSKHD